MSAMVTLFSTFNKAVSVHLGEIMGLYAGKGAARLGGTTTVQVTGETALSQLAGHSHNLNTT